MVQELRSLISGECFCLQPDEIICIRQFQRRRSLVARQFREGLDDEELAAMYEYLVGLRD